MKYCPNCGNPVNENANVCLSCGRLLQEEKTNTSFVPETTPLSKSIVVIFSILNPIFGAVLYYVFKKTNPKLAKIANRCSWLSFLLYPVIIVLYHIIVNIIFSV